MITRQIAKETDPIGLQAVSGVIAVGIMLPLLLVTSGMGIDALTLIAPNGFEWGMLWTIGNWQPIASSDDMVTALCSFCHFGPHAISGNTNCNDYWIFGVQGLAKRAGRRWYCHYHRGRRLYYLTGAGHVVCASGDARACVTSPNNRRGTMHNIPGPDMVNCMGPSALFEVPTL